MTGYLCRNTRVARFFVGKEMHKLRAFRGKLDRGEMTLADIRCSVDSYNGHMKRGHSFKVRQRTNQYFKSLYGFYPDEKGWKSHV